MASEPQEKKTGLFWKILFTVLGGIGLVIGVIYFSIFLILDNLGEVENL